MPVWVVAMIVSAVMSVAAYMLAPKPKVSSATQRPQAVDTPTVDAARPVPVVFGRVRVKSPNLLWMGGQRSEEIKR